jgi:hypothetical protein
MEQAEPRPIVETIETLGRRIAERLPEAGPQQLLSGSHGTASSPRCEPNPAELGRDLDDCSEMLASTGKVATICVAELDDPVVLEAVTEVENLTTGLSRKVWQKRMVLHRPRPAGRSAYLHAA